MIRPIYLDYHATTPIDPRVVERVVYAMTEAFGNPSSADHAYGEEATSLVGGAAHQVADLLGTHERNVVFTSGATESLNHVIQSVAYQAGGRARIAMMPIEHKAVLDPVSFLARSGTAEMVGLHVDRLGRLDLDHFEQVCSSRPALVCVMAANNELGTLYPISKVGEIARRYDIPLLVDATQAAGKVLLEFDAWGITYLALSAHKMYGPKGCGALIAKPSSDLTPLIRGGGHQRGRRSGTLNVPGIVGLGEACRLRAAEGSSDEAAIRVRRDHLQNYLEAGIAGLRVNGDPTARLAGSLHVSIPDVPNGALLARLRPHLALSTGAACAGGLEQPSHVLQAIGMPPEEQEGALRICLGKFTTDAEVEEAAEHIIQAVQATRLALAGTTGSL